MAASGIGLVSGVVKACARAAGQLVTQRGGRSLYAREGRSHLAVRGLHGPQASRVAADLEKRLTEHPAVTWAAVNAALQTVVVATGGGEEEAGELPDGLLELVEEVERAHGVDGEPLPSSHPAGPRSNGKAAWSLALQAAALPVAAVSRFARFSPLPPEVTAFIPEIDYEPRLRRLTESLIGRENAGLVLAGLNAVFQASAGGILGLSVDTARHGLRVAELTAHRATWYRAEPRMTGTAASARAEALDDVPPRARELADGPVERYTARAVYLSGASFAAALALSRRPRSAAAAALAGIPKAPVLTREGFACVLGAVLAARGAPVENTEALRRLDRLDCLVLDTGALGDGGYRPADLVPLDKDARPGQLAATVYRLFDRDDPGRVAEADNWRLGPLESLPLRGRTGRRVAGPLRGGDARMLGLAEGSRLMAVVRAAPEVPDAARLLVDAAHRSRLRVVARGPLAASVVPGADEVAPQHESAGATVRRLQDRGAGVMLVSRDRRGLACADLGVGVAGEPDAVAWGAHVHVTSPGAAVTLAEACGPARSASRRGVRLGQAAVGLGGASVVAGADRRAAARSMAAVNGAAALGMAYGAWSAAAVVRRPPDPVPAQEPWHAMPSRAVLDRVGSGQDGLSDAQASRRGEPGGGGPHGPSLVRSVAAELANPLTPVLLGGAALSAAVGGVLDAVIVVGVTALSGVIGGTQRFLTDREVNRLHERSEVTALVVRAGQERRTGAGGLVVGDVVRLSGGDVVPADCRLVHADGLEVDESALTGESVPVTKDEEPVLAADVAERTCMVYEGTTVATGRGTAVVVATGAATEAGRSARAARGAAPRVGVERRLTRLTRTSLPAALGSAGAVVAAGFLHRRPVRESIGAGVGLAVASVPEGLPFLVSAAQLAAARRLAAQGVLVRDPRTVEAAGRADVLCFDKTGTLTRGRVELTGVEAEGISRPLPHLQPGQRAVLAAALRATPRARPGRRLEHFTDRAVSEGAERAGVTATADAPGFRREARLPFEPSRGFHATRGRTGGTRLLSVKGAPEEVVGRCATYRGGRLDTQRVLARGERLASAGHRVLAVAERRDAPGGPLDDEGVAGLDFLGFLLLGDEVRGGAAGSVRRLAEAGVQIVMITGDHPGTAEAIARQLDVLNGRRVVTGTELDGLDDDGLDALLPSVGVVARGTPAHKVRVVQGFQRLGRTVAMTGDGSNDAPAIRLADVGIALGARATAAARAAADLVVTNDDLETILAALVEGRSMWASVRQALAVLVGGNLGEIGFTVLGSAIGGSSPLTARQFLLVNLFTDLAPAIAVALRRPRPEVAQKQLHEGPETSLGSALTQEITVRAAATAAGAGAAWIAGRATGRPARARTIALAALVTTQLGQTLVVGGRSPAVAASALGSAAALAAVIQTPGLSHFFGCVPLGPVGWATALACAAAATAGAVAVDPARTRTAPAADGHQERTGTAAGPQDGQPRARDTAAAPAGR